MLAETVSLTDEEILVILIALLGILLAIVATFGLGCFWAWRAGRGSGLALAGWIVVASIEGLVVLVALPRLVQGQLSAFPALPLGAIAIQAVLYVSARERHRSR